MQHSFFRVSYLLQTTVFHNKISKSSHVLGEREMRMWGGDGEQEKHNCKDCAASYFLILTNSSFHYYTPIHTRHFSLLSPSIIHLNGLLAPPPAFFCCLYFPTSFPSFLFRTLSCFSQGSSLNLKTFKYFPFCPNSIQLLSPIFFLLFSITLYKYNHNDTPNIKNTFS